VQGELNQEEIDAMVRAARSGGRADPGRAKEPRVEPWDVRRAGQIGRTQLQAITHLHEIFARNLTNALASYLRVMLTATLVSAEHLTYREFTERIPEMTYLAACKMQPMGLTGTLQLDLKVAFPIIDLLLGGEGRPLTTPRDITDIEQPIVESVARIVCRELGAAWSAVELQVDFEKQIELGDVMRLMAPHEKVLSLSFEVALADVRGGLNLAVPVTLSHALLRKIAVSWGDRPRAPEEWQAQLRTRLLECGFPVELCAGGLTSNVGELSRLDPGTLLRLGRSAGQPASLSVGGVETFSAIPARRGEVRAAQLLEMVVKAEAKRKGEEGRGAEGRGADAQKEADSR
jgi:flagellar motor switch protein FliM